MGKSGWLQVPVGDSAGHWVTRPALRTVLVVAHSATALQRLLDVTPLFESDHRIQTVFTAGAGAFSHPVEEILRGLQAVVMPWDQATRSRFDVALSSGYTGLKELNVPVLALAHGAGHNKLVPNAGEHATSAGPALYGLSPEQLVRNGRLVVSTVGLSHIAEIETLREKCPIAVPRASVIGDPCFDRIVLSRSRRAEYRRALGVRDDQRLMVVCSTWGRYSLFGARLEIVDQVLQDAADGKTVVAMLLHPAVWYGHGLRQVRSWLRGYGRRGLTVVEPDREWRSVLIAADRVVGDHGSTALYAIAAGASLVQIDFPSELIAPGSPMDLLRAVTPKWDASRSPSDQFAEIESAQDDWSRRGVVERITSEPENSPALLRRVIYDYLDLAEPSAPATFETVPVPLASLYSALC